MSDAELKPYNTDLQVAAYFEVSRGTVWRWVRKRGFPPPVQLGPHTVRWRRKDILEWEDQLEMAA